MEVSNSSFALFFFLHFFRSFIKCLELRLCFSIVALLQCSAVLVRDAALVSFRSGLVHGWWKSENIKDKYILEVAMDDHV